MTRLFISTLLTSTVALWVSGIAFAIPSNDPLVQACINQQLRNHQNIKNKRIEPGDFSNHCTCVARVMRNLANDQQLSELNSPGHQTKPEWFTEIERSAQKQCMIDPQSKLQST
jgi:hypothetical protein